MQPLVKDELIARNRFFGQEFQDRSIRRGIVYGFISVMISNSAKFADLRGACSDSMPIVMAGLCQRLKAGLVKKLVVFAIKLFPGKDRTVVGDANPDDLDDANEMQIAQRCHEASAAADDLLQAFVMSKAQAISNCICDQLSGSDWMAAPEPTKVSPYVIDAVKMFEETREMARVVFGAKEDKISKLSTYQQHIANRSRGNMGASPTGDLFDKIFSERVEVYSKVEFKTHSVRGTLRRHYYRFICIRLLGSGLIRQRQRLAGGSACFSQPNTTPRPLFLVFGFPVLFVCSQRSRYR